MSCFVNHLAQSKKTISGFASPFAIILSLLIMLSVGTDSFSQEKTNKNSLPEWVAGKYGIDSFSDISSIAFTFNVRNKDVTVKRTWAWEPKTGRVVYNGPGISGADTSVTYNRNQIDTQSATTVYADKRFINDQYWLLFPFHMVWDKNVDIKIDGKKKFPLSDETGTSLIVEYKNNVGYTPNDVFVLFLGDDNMIRQWIYRPGGSKEKERPYTWESNKKFDGITISTEHYGKDNQTKVWFTNIKVEANHTIK